jgi:hypothetical protein
MHAIPLDALQQVDVLERIGARCKRVQGRGQHGDIALDVLDAAFPEWRTRSEKRVRHRLDCCQRAPAGCRIGQIGNEMAEGCLA